MRGVPCLFVLGLFAAGCGGTTFYDVEGGPPLRDLTGMRVYVKPFDVGDVEGMTNREAADSATTSFIDALFGGPFKLVGRGADLQDIMQERNLSESDLIEDSGEIAKLLKADLFVSGKVITARQSGHRDAPTGSEVEISVVGTSLDGEMIFRGKQRARSTQSGFGIGHIKIGRRPAMAVRDLMTIITKNLASLMLTPPGGGGGESSAP